MFPLVILFLPVQISEQSAVPDMVRNSITLNMFMYVYIQEVLKQIPTDIVVKVAHRHLHKRLTIRLRTIMAMILLNTRVAAVSASMTRMELYRVRQPLSLCIIRNAQIAGLCRLETACTFL